MKKVIGQSYNTTRWQTLKQSDFTRLSHKLGHNVMTQSDETKWWYTKMKQCDDAKSWQNFVGAM